VAIKKPKGPLKKERKRKRGFGTDQKGRPDNQMKPHPDEQGTRPLAPQHHNNGEDKNPKIVLTYKPGRQPDTKVFCDEKTVNDKNDGGSDH